MNRASFKSCTIPPKSISYVVKKNYALMGWGWLPEEPGATENNEQENCFQNRGLIKESPHLKHGCIYNTSLS